MAPRIAASVETKLARKWHWHQCSDRDCRTVYDCRCATPLLNGLCHQCAGYSVPEWARNRRPCACCLANCVQVTRADELIRYELAGSQPWYQCRTCKRSHGWPKGAPPDQVAADQTERFCFCVPPSSAKHPLNDTKHPLFKAE